MHSWEALNPVTLRPVGPVTAAFSRFGMKDLRSAGQYIRCLPYGRNTYPEDPLIVLTEERGTCSTKHALLRRLATEQGLDIALVLGIYEMNEQNTPGVGHALRKYGFSTLPEAHCYLRAFGKRVDVTRAIDIGPATAMLHFLHEEDITPAQITHYKTALHQQFLSWWMADHSELGGWTLADVWAIREECIAGLSG